jgi:hypothetical protein
MAYQFGSLIFTSAIKALQEKYGSRRQYARREAAGPVEDPIGPAEAQFLDERDSFYMATVGEGGWPYVQHRGGARGFLKVIDGHTVAFADFRGNKQYITTGNLLTDARAAFILVDYPSRSRLKLLGQVQVFEGAEAKEWIAKLGDASHEGTAERVFVVHVRASDWNCSQHITPRFTEEEIQSALAPWEHRFETLQKENEELRGQLKLSHVADASRNDGKLMAENR